MSCEDAESTHRPDPLSNLLVMRETVRDSRRFSVSSRPQRYCRRHWVQPVMRFNSVSLLFPTLLPCRRIPVDSRGCKKQTEGLLCTGKSGAAALVQSGAVPKSLDAHEAYISLNQRRPLCSGSKSHVSFSVDQAGQSASPRFR